MICSACRQENEPGIQACSRCGASVNRSLPPLLVLESVFTRELLWGNSVAGLVLPLLLLGFGFWGAWAIWNAVGLSSYWSIAGYALLAPGTIFTLSLLPVLPRFQSALAGLGFFVMFSLLVAGLAGLIFAIYLFSTIE